MPAGTMYKVLAVLGPSHIQKTLQGSPWLQDPDKSILNVRHKTAGVPRVQWVPTTDCVSTETGTHHHPLGSR